MPRVTLYVKDTDVPVWDRAKELAGKGADSLSAFVTSAVAELVHRRSSGMEAIELDGFADSALERPRRIRFTGFLVHGVGDELAVYVTRSGRIVGVEQSPGTNNQKVIYVFNCFEDLAHHPYFSDLLEPGIMDEIAQATDPERVEDLDA